MTYEYERIQRGSFPEYRVRKVGNIEGFVRCYALADAAFLVHVLNNITPQLHGEACEAAVAAYGEKTNAA